jgi:hypothetical protein
MSDFTTGEHAYRIDFAMQKSKETPPTMVPYPQTSLPYWRLALTLYIPYSEWKGHYQVKQRYEVIRKENGELVLRPV